MTSRPSSGNTFALLFAVLALLLLVPTSLASKEAPAPSPSAEVDLICHTNNPAECYPRIFQPTEEFQIVRDDQEIPNGLHVRLDISTGQKEAKLNVPEEHDPALDGLPSDSGVLIVEPEEAAGGEEGLADKPVIPAGAPIYEMFGKVKPPENESPEFYSNLEFVKKGPGGADLPLDEALEFLEEISHDMYYGGKIAENPDTVKALLCLMVQPEPETATGSKTGQGPSPTPHGHQAASILAAALQNNPQAISDVGAAWAGFMDSTCSASSGADSSGGAKKLRDELYASFVPKEPLALDAVPSAAARAKAHVAAFSSLLRSATVRADFLASGGMDRLVEALAPAAKEWEGVQRKVGHLLLDNFLDVELGATTGDWPLFRAAETDAEKRRAARASDETWLAAVRAVRDRNKGNGGHWSSEVLTRLERLHEEQLKALPREEL